MHIIRALSPQSQLLQLGQELASHCPSVLVRLPCVPYELLLPTVHFVLAPELVPQLQRLGLYEQALPDELPSPSFHDPDQISPEYPVPVLPELSIVPSSISLQLSASLVVFLLLRFIQ